MPDCSHRLHDDEYFYRTTDVRLARADLGDLSHLCSPSTRPPSSADRPAAAPPQARPARRQPDLILMSKSARHPDVLYPFLRWRYLVVRLRRLDSTGRLGALYSTTSRVGIMGHGTCRRASSTAVKTMCASGAEPVQDRERCARPRHLSSRTPRAALTAVTPSCRSYDFFTTYRSLERDSTCA